MWTIGSSIIAALAFSLSLFSDSFEPVQAFLKAKQLIEQNGLSDATRPLLEMSKSDPDLAPWANLLEAKVLAAKGEFLQSLGLLSSIPDSHASSLDARMEILKLIYSPNADRIPGKYKPSNVMGYMLDLERDAQGSRRKDLLTELDFLRAEIAENQNELAVASEILMKLRESSRGEDAARRAKQQLFELRRKYASILGLVSLSDRQREAKQLLKEGAFDEALSLVKEAERLISHSSPAYVELALLEAKLLHKLEKHRDVEQLLTAIISVNTPGSSRASKDDQSVPNPKLAEKALMELSKHFWNKNDIDKTLVYTTQLIQLNAEPAQSSTRAEAFYVQGRVLEEASRLEEAIAAYKKVDQERPTMSIRLSATRRLAWVALRRKDYPKALDAFNQVVTIAESDLETRNPNLPAPEGEFSLSSAQMQDELRHALYWSAEIILKHTNSAQGNAEGTARLKRIINEAPYSYYALLSGKLLGKEMAIELDPNAADYDSSTRLSSTKACYDAVATSPFRKHLHKLQEYHLTDFATKEVEWYFYRKLNPPADAPSLNPVENAPLRPLTTGLSRAQLFEDLKIYRPGIGAAIEVESQVRKLQVSQDQSVKDFLGMCEGELLKRLYPLAFLEEYSRVADRDAQVDFPLLLAVSRRESHFDPEARSSAGALGLMQLMPATAKLEGWKAEESLFNPQINIPLGAKHLKRLIIDFKGNEAQAIAAYNAGSKPVNNWINQFPNLSTEEWVELIGYSETRQYVKAVLLGEHLYSRVLRK